MKRPRREGGGGEIALMAVITKAMGAFLVLVVIMLPHYSFNRSESKSAEAAQKQVDQSKQAISLIADTLKKGPLTDAEIDALLRKIAEISAQLEEAQRQIAALKGERDQALAEIARLQSAKKAREAEIAKLQSELEKLKTYEPPMATATLTWGNCPGAMIDLYVLANKVGVNGERAPPVDRTLQQPFFRQEKKNNIVLAGNGGVGGAWWRTPDFGEDRTFYVWAKLINAVYPSAKTRPRKCEVFAAFENAKGQQVVTSRFVMGDESPIKLVFAIDSLKTGGMEIHPLATEEVESLRKAAYEGKCAGMLCSHAYSNAENEPTAQAKPRFVEVVKLNSAISDASAGAIFDLMADGRISVADGHRWLALFLESTAASPPTADKIRVVTELLKTRGAPKGVATEALDLLRAGRTSADKAIEVLSELPATDAPLESVEEDAANSDSDAHRAKSYQAAITAAKADAAAAKWRAPLEELQSKSSPRGKAPAAAAINERLAKAHVSRNLEDALRKLMKQGLLSLEDFDKAAASVERAKPSP